MPEGGRALRPFLSTAAAIVLASAGICPAALPERSDRIVSYRIEVSLDPSTHTIHGKERVTWRNATAAAATELQLHLYLNAFKNERSTFLKESRGSHRGQSLVEGEWGWIDLDALSLEGGADLLAGASFIHPDDDNAEDETVLRVPLPQPVPPGGSISFDAAFTSRLPRVFARTGFKNDFHLAGQWFPKLGVLQDSGWNCHQFHANSEFFADFGSFDVTVTVPSSFVVGATGALAGPPKENADGTTSYRFTQDDVHDFAWTADPRYRKITRPFSYAERRDPEEERRMARVLGLDASRIPPKGAADLSGVPEEIRLRDVEVTLLLHPDHAGTLDRHFDAAFAGLLYFGYWYGRYPYATLTVVDPPWGGRGAGGMEYPTFITAGASTLAPRKRLSPEGVTVHEFGHQFWYGMVANNEFEESWLDEGFNTYSTGKVMEKAFGPNHDTIDVAGVPLVRFALAEIPDDPDPARATADREVEPDQALTRFLYMRWAGASNDSLLDAFRDLPMLTFPSAVAVPEPWSQRRRYLKQGPKKDDLLRRSWEYYDNESYGLNSYAKTALVLRTLEGVLGEDVVARAMRVYHERWRFRHPTTGDFIATVNEVAGRDLGPYFDQTVRGSDLLDYSVSSLSTRPRRPGAGVFGKADGRRTVTRAEARAAGPEEGEKEYSVTVRRIGEVVVPVEVELRFEGGKAEIVPWDGRYRWTRLKGTTDRKLLSARVYPAGGWPLDADWSNNARAATPTRAPALKWWSRFVVWAQQVLYFYSGIA